MLHNLTKQRVKLSPLIPVLILVPIKRILSFIHLTRDTSIWSVRNLSKLTAQPSHESTEQC